MLLKGDLSMRVFENGFRPWPHVFKNNGRSQKIYEKIDRNLEEELMWIRNYNQREDTVNYCALLRQVLQCFGEGIIESLEFTMKHYLHQTDGKYSNHKSKTWEKQAVNKQIQEKLKLI